MCKSVLGIDFRHFGYVISLILLYFRAKVRFRYVDTERMLAYLHVYLIHVCLILCLKYEPKVPSKVRHKTEIEC